MLTISSNVLVVFIVVLYSKHVTSKGFIAPAAVKTL